jgi:hypothetical protein
VNSRTTRVPIGRVLEAQSHLVLAQAQREDDGAQGEARKCYEKKGLGSQRLLVGGPDGAAVPGGCSQGTAEVNPERRGKASPTLTPLGETFYPPRDESGRCSPCSGWP